MRCVKCGMNLRKAAAFIPSSHMAVPYPVGPVCARKLGLLAPVKPRKAAAVVPSWYGAVRRSADPLQVDWVTHNQGTTP